MTRNNEGSGRKAFNVALIIIFVMIVYGFFFHLDRKIQAANYQLPSLHTEELTWTEVRQAMDRGFKTIIIPTGGTEQNGPHMVLGKHNYVVRYTSEKVAQELGKTLVAPVISYVPQGELEPEPTLHLRYPGTVGIPADVYESVLEHAARSYKSQGFKKIIFLGDSFGNQDGQNNVAETLSKKWQSENIKVIHVADYYQNNNQFETLLSQGFSNEEIGYHAGIRDTSEIMYVYPEGFRQNPVLLDAVNDYGYSGKPDKASDEIGKKMIDLKVKSAVKAIREYR